jgi:ABC-type nitrate/sulfonate/bicarbonate transport system substrate-binding protein
MIRKNARILRVIVVIIALIILAAGIIMLTQQPPAKSVRNISGCPSPGMPSGLLKIAQQNGYFAENGLNVTLNIKDYPTANLGVQGVLDGKLEFTTINEYTAAQQMFRTSHLRIICSIGESETNTLVARRDKGIDRLEDLEGKRIGVSRGSQSEYFLYRFFTMNGLSLKNITMVNLKNPDMPDAIIKGDIDVAMIQEPYSYEIKQRLGNNAISWSPQLGQKSTYVIAVNDTFAKTNPEIIRGFLASLLEAERYVNEHNDEAKKLIQKEYGYDDPYMADQWNKQYLAIRLPQSLVTSMDDEARFMIRYNLVNATTIPHYIDYIDSGYLRELKPTSVTIIG